MFGEGKSKERKARRKEGRRGAERRGLQFQMTGERSLAYKVSVESRG